MSMKNSDNIGNLSRDLPVCSTVPRLPLEINSRLLSFYDYSPVILFASSALPRTNLWIINRTQIFMEIRHQGKLKRSKDYCRVFRILFLRLKIADISNQNVYGFSGFDLVSRCDW
jgi:hypothetical protein